MGLPPRSVEHNGCQLAYDVRGNGPPVLFIQGVGVHGDGWLPQVDALSATYTCVSFDNRGMAGIPGARYVEHADASHGLPIQWADRVNAQLAEHLAAAEAAWAKR